MRGTTPPGTVGYVVVSLPDTGEWQGFFVTEAYAGAGESLLEQVAGLSAGPGGPEVVSPVPGGAAEDQKSVGVISAALADFFSRGVARPQPEAAESAAIMAGVGAAAWALVRATGERWLVVTGRPDRERGGMSTTVMPVEAADLDAAREAMVSEIGRSKKADALRDAILGMFRTPPLR